VKSLAEEARNQGALAWSMTVRGTVHVNQSDFSLLYPNVCSIFLKMTANPQRTIDINIDASMEFLKIVMPRSIAGINRTSNCERLLETVVVIPNEVPAAEKHRPGKRWIAARLKISHELQYRLGPEANKRRKERKKLIAGANRGMEGFSWPGDEVWMHSAPSEEEMRKHGVIDEETRQTEGKEKSFTENVAWQKVQEAKSGESRGQGEMNPISSEQGHQASEAQGETIGMGTAIARDRDHHIPGSEFAKEEAEV